MDKRSFNFWLAVLPAPTAAQKQRPETALTGSDPATSVALVSWLRSVFPSVRIARPGHRCVVGMRVDYNGSSAMPVGGRLTF